MKTLALKAVAIAAAASLAPLALANNQLLPVNRVHVPTPPRQTNPLVNAVIRAKVIDNSGMFLFEMTWRLAGDQNCAGEEVTPKGSTKHRGRWRWSSDNNTDGEILIDETAPARTWRGRVKLPGTPTMNGIVEGEVWESKTQQAGRFKGIVSLPK